MTPECPTPTLYILIYQCEWVRARFVFCSTGAKNTNPQYLYMYIYTDDYVVHFLRPAVSTASSVTLPTTETTTTGKMITLAFVTTRCCDWLLLRWRTRSECSPWYFLPPSTLFPLPVPCIERISPKLSSSLSAEAWVKRASCLICHLKWLCDDKDKEATAATAPVVATANKRCLCPSSSTTKRVHALSNFSTAGLPTAPRHRYNNEWLQRWVSVHT